MGFLGKQITAYLREINVPAAHDQSCILTPELFRVLQHTSEGNCCRRFNDDLHTLPDQSHCLDRILIVDKNDFTNEFLNYGEVPLSQVGAQPVAYCIGID